MKNLLLFINMLLGFASIQAMAFAQIPNPGFENWTAGEPDGWRTDNVAQLVSVVQSPTAHSGNSSVRLQVFDEFGSLSCGGLWLDSTIALTVIPTALTGWYQFHPTGGETVQLEGSVSDPPINYATFYSQDFFPPASSWTPFSMPIDYAYTPVSPDSATFYFLMYCGPQSTLSSYLLLDDLAFEVIVGNETSNIAHLKTSTYPNPVTDELYVGFEVTTPSNGSIELMDINGHILQRKKFYASQPGWSAERFDTRGLTSGMYVALVKMGDRNSQARIQVVR